MHDELIACLLTWSVPILSANTGAASVSVLSSVMGWDPGAMRGRTALYFSADLFLW